MAQPVYIKVVGFTDEERHAINTMFRLSEQGETVYMPWSAEAPEPAGMALLDGESWEAQLEAESPSAGAMKLIWIGANAPIQVWRSFPRPIHWPDVVRAMDSVFAPEQPLDFDIGESDGGAPAPGAMSHQRALIVSASREARLYLRARLALARITHADEAETGAQALELAQAGPYDVALVDFELKDMDAWVLLKQLRHGSKPIAHMAIINAPRTLPKHVRAWLSGTEALLGKPPHPRRLIAWLNSLPVGGQ